MLLKIKCNRDSIWEYAKDNYPEYPNIDDESLDDLMLTVYQIENCEYPHINNVRDCFLNNKELVLCRDSYCDRGYLVTVDSYDETHVVVTLKTPFS